ncbi:MAG: LPS assembly protein LptD [Rickettsiales bacterium]|nr:LPS assembly protein LptD [Rickettsiales bacterium]
MAKRLLAIFFVFAFSTIVLASDNKIVIKADSLSKSKKQNNVSASGNVEFIKDKYKIISEKVVFNKGEKKILFTGKTKLLDTENNNIFADSGEVSDDIESGVFNNAGIILNNGLFIIAPSINKDGNKYFLKKCKFYFCKNNDLNIDLPFDSIKKEADKISKQPISVYSLKSTMDKDKEKIHFNHMFVRLFNIPVFYLPRFSTSAGFKDNISGVSNPKILTDGSYGIGIELPYNLYLLGDKLRLKITPTFYFRHKNILLENNFNYKKDNFFTSLYYAFASDRGASKNITNINSITEIGEGKYNNYRDYINLKIQHKFNENFFYFSEMYYTNDSYFPRDYLNNYDNFLNSNFLLYKEFNSRNFLKVTGLKINTIRERADAKILDNPREVVNIKYFHPILLYGGENRTLNLNFDSSLNTVFDREKNEFDRFSININLNYSYLLNNLLMEYNVDLYQDNYMYFIDKKSELTGNENRSVLDFNVNLNYNLYAGSVNIRPIFQYYYNNSNKNNLFIDKDSKNSTLSITNIFSGNRYGGLDLFEYGTRINYGVEMSAFIKNYNLSFMTAQGYKDKVNSDYKIDYFEENFSDILNELSIYDSYNDISFGYLNVLDKTTLRVKQQNFLLNFSRERLDFEISYIFLKHTDAVLLNRFAKHQLNLLAQYKINSDFRIGVDLNEDLERKKLAFIKTNLVFERNCLEIELAIGRYNYIGSNDKRGWNFNISMRIKN